MKKCHIQVRVHKNFLASSVWQIGLERNRKVNVITKSSVNHTSSKTYFCGLHSNMLHKEVAHDTAEWWHCSQHRALGSINGRKEMHFWRQTLLKPFTAPWEFLYSESAFYSILVEEPLCTGAIQTHSGIYITQGNLPSCLAHLIFMHFVRDIEVLGRQIHRSGLQLSRSDPCASGPLERAERTAFGFIHSAAL